MFINLFKKLKSTTGNSLAEFAVTTAMMATLATTAAPKFSGVGEGAKESRGRFPGQVKYNEAVGGYASEALLETGLESFTGYDSQEGGSWASVFGTTTEGAVAPSGHNISTVEDDNDDGSFDVSVGAEEFLNEFGGNPIKSPFQDGHMIYAVVAGGGSGSSSYSPILYVADLENPNNFKKKLQP